MFSIKNELLEVEISPKAAEVHVLKKINEDYNYVWCGDPNYWAGRNPILFPQVNSNSDKTFLIDGVKYQTGNHGFARHATFELVEQKDDELTLITKDNEETLNQYPFKFELMVNYKLEANKLNITYTITNKDNKIMPYGFGLHPAFACLHDYKDTKVLFNKEESFGKELIINKELFEKYPTYFMYDVKSNKATLVTGDKEISVEFAGFNIFAIWSKGDYVCLEPWINNTDEDPSIELKDRKGIEFLNRNESRTYKYSWVVER